MTRACLTRLRSASRVSHPHGGFLRSALPGLLHPGSACGVLPFRAFSSRGAVAPSRCPNAFLVLTPPACSGRLTGTVARRAMARTRSLPGSVIGQRRKRSPSRPCSPRKFVATGSGLGHPGPDALLGFLLFRDSTTAPGREVLSRRLPSALRRGVRRLAPPLALAVAVRSTPARRFGRSLSRPAAPREVFHLVTPLGSSEASAALAHGFTSGPGPRRHALSDPLGAVTPSPPKHRRWDFIPCFLPRPTEWPRVGAADTDG